MDKFEVIHIETSIDMPVKEVWKSYTNPEDIIKWNAASEDWHTTKSENNLVAGGRFLSRMEAKDGSFGFDFCGVYDEVIENELIKYTMDDNRKVTVTFSEEGSRTWIGMDFEAESENSTELQKNGWQSILDNFGRYVIGG